MSELGISPQAIERVLSCEAHYDDLNDPEQAIVRAEWSNRTEQRRRDLDLAAEFTAEGRPYVELDNEGNIVRYQP